MKSLIKLLSILAISSPIPLTVVGCDHKKETQKVELETLNQKINLKENATKINLNTITKLSGFYIIANPSKTYKQLISNINNFNEFKLTPLAIGYQLQFYNENNKDITNDKQELENVSKIIVKIISSFDDEHYQGSTNIDLTNQTIITD